VCVVDGERGSVEGIWHEDIDEVWSNKDWQGLWNNFEGGVGRGGGMGGDDGSGGSKRVLCD
jgi:hypothetical protein